jgi:REP element-mobilizing transposase RayT
MIAFHLIISAYGFWLPNDPRGSWSDFVGSWELYRFGPATKVDDRRNYAKDPHDRALRLAAKQVLKYPPVRFNDVQRSVVGRGFGQAVRDARYVVHACCVGFDHAHLVVERHTRDINVIAGHLKAAATRAIGDAGVHPLERFVGKRGGPPTPWSEGCWKVFIDDIAQLRAAVDYVRRHPAKEGLPAQSWNFTTTCDAVHGIGSPMAPPHCFSIPSSSTSNTRVALGGMGPLPPGP